MKKTVKLFTVMVVLSLLVVPVLLAGGGREAAPEEKPNEVTIAAGAVGMELELVRKAAQQYMDENPGVTVNVLDTPDLADDRMGLYLQFFESQSSEVDLYQIDVIWPGDLAHHFYDLYEFGAAQYVDDHFPAIVENNTVDGKLIGMPWFTDAGLLYYRTDLLEKYGYDGPPKTWADLEEMAETIMKGERDAGNQDFWGFVWQGNAYEGLTCDAIEWIASNCGGTIISPDGVITVNNPNAIEIVEKAAGWVGTISPPGVVGHAEEDARAIWQGGNAAFMRNWPYAYSLGQSEDSVIRNKFDVSPLPAGKSGSGAAALGGWQMGLSKYSANPELAADVLFFMTGYEMQKMRAVEGTFNPTIMSLYEDQDVLTAAPFFGSLYDVFINAVARPSTVSAPRYAETSQIFFENVHDVITGRRTGAAAFREMEADLQDLHGFPTGDPDCN